MRFVADFVFYMASDWKNANTVNQYFSYFTSHTVNFTPQNVCIPYYNTKHGNI